MVIAYLRVGTSNKELLEEQKNEINAMLRIMI